MYCIWIFSRINHLNFIYYSKDYNPDQEELFKELSGDLKNELSIIKF